MQKKKNKMNHEAATDIIILASVFLLVHLMFPKKKQRKADLGSAVLDASEINGKPLGVNENGELIIYDKKQ